VTSRVPCLPGQPPSPQDNDVAENWRVESRLLDEEPNLAVAAATKAAKEPRGRDDNSCRICCSKRQSNSRTDCCSSSSSQQLSTQESRWTWRHHRWRWRKTTTAVKAQLPPQPCQQQQLSPAQWLSSVLSQQLSSLLVNHFNIVKLLIILALFTNKVLMTSAMPPHPEDADHVTAIYGDWVVLNCVVDFPDGNVVPYVVHWWRKDKPVYIWYSNYPSHVDKAYKNRVSKVDAASNKYGLASLNLTKVTENDRGWYNCKVRFLNRSPDTLVNGTWYHLDVHAKPRFVEPEKMHPIVYASVGESIILRCHAEGTPLPEVLWFKNDKPVKIRASHLGVFNDGTELRISKVRESDLGAYYTCIARNGEGRIEHVYQVVKAGGAVITKPPYNKTVVESQDVVFPCKGEARPGNLTTRWYKEGVSVKAVDGLSKRAQISGADGSLTITGVAAEDEGKYTCEITNGMGKPVTAFAFLAVEYPARVVYTETTQYIPKGLSGVIRCHVSANPPVQFVTWMKDKRALDLFGSVGMMGVNGSILIDKVSSEHQGNYECTPYNLRGTAGKSGVMQVLMKDPPTFASRAEAEYHRNVGGKVEFPCIGMGDPRPTTTWRRVDGAKLPRKRHKIFNGELTLENLRKSDHGVYECVVSNKVATVVHRTELFIERTTPHAPQNVTVTNSGTFAVTIEWMPGYSGCASCKQEYKIRYRLKDSKFTNWMELPVNPPDARFSEIFNLNPNTNYEFQVIGTNEYGDGMFSEIIQASTKDVAYFDVNLLPKDTKGNIVFPSVPKVRDGNAEKPGAPHGLNLTQEAGGWVLRWFGPKDDSKVLYYTIEYKTDTNDPNWHKFTEAKVDKEEASYLIKNMGTARAYDFRVLSHSAASYSISETYTYKIPDDVKDRAVTAGLIGGILFFIVAIILSVCTVKICNKKRRRKQERAYSVVTSGGHVTQVPLKRHGEGRIPTVSFGGVNLIDERRKSYKAQGPKSLRKGLLSVFNTATDYVHQLHDRVKEATTDRDTTSTSMRQGFYDANLQGYDSDELDYSGGLQRRTGRGNANKKNKYSVHLEYCPSQPGYGVNRGPHRTAAGTRLISRNREGKFVLDEDENNGGGGHGGGLEDEGGFEIKLPPNRFRTRSVAIVAGYSPERLYSNMPAGAFVVESGMYKVGADRGTDWGERPEPIYWKQVVYGARNQPHTGSDGSGTLPKPPPYLPPLPHSNMQQQFVGQLGAEDIRRLRELDPAASSNGLVNPSLPPPLAPTYVNNNNQSQFAENLSAIPLVQPFYNNMDSTSRLVRTSNLELLRHRSSRPRLRASSPLNQEAPLIEWTANNFSEISSVPHPSSLEPSIPSTLLTTTSTGGGVTTGGGESSGSSRSLSRKVTATLSSELGTIPENEYASQTSMVHADVHAPLPLLPGTATPTSSSAAKEDKGSGLYWQRHTYRNADAMFPNYALNYPTPVHGSISPSRQYPPSDQNVLPRFGFEDYQAGMLDPYYPYHATAAQQQQFFTTSQFAQPQQPVLLQPQQQQQQQLPQQQQQPHQQLQPPPPQQPNPPLATSSPPVQRKHVYHNQGYQSDHDYENMRYSLQHQAPPARPSRQKDTRSQSQPVVATTSSSLLPTSGGASVKFFRDRKAGRAAVGGKGPDAVSLVSEDAEVTAITHSSSPGSSVGSTAGVPSKRMATTSAGKEDSTSSGVAPGSKNQSSSSATNTSGNSRTGGGGGQSTQTSFLDEPPDLSKTHLQPYYENLPYQIDPTFAYQQYIPPLVPHVNTLHSHAKMLPSPSELVKQGHSPPALMPAAVVTGGLDSSSERAGGGVALGGGGGGSRPGSSHSAPMLDLSIDRHYEFDSARTPTDDLLRSGGGLQATKAELPVNWNRPYLGYNPRTRDRELGSAAELARSEQRVFSDSEIYSPVFPRGRPEPRVDVSARVEAMRKEFAEYQRQISPRKSSTSSATKEQSTSTHPDDKASSTKIPTDHHSTKDEEDDRLESLI